MRRMMILASVVLVVASVPLVSAQGKGKGKGSNSVTGNLGLALKMQNDLNGDERPNWGDSITFDVSVSEEWNQVDVTCSQNGVGVYGAVWPLSPVVTLMSTAWGSGAADCTAVVISYATRKPLAQLSFHVAD
jgi:hypothetical protein